MHLTPRPRRQTQHQVDRLPPVWDVHPEGLQRGTLPQCVRQRPQHPTLGVGGGQALHRPRQLLFTNPLPKILDRQQAVGQFTPDGRQQSDLRRTVRNRWGSSKAERTGR